MTLDTPMFFLCLHYLMRLSANFQVVFWTCFWSLSLFVFRSDKTLHVEDATRTQQQGPTVVISQWYRVYIARNRIHFKTQKNWLFPGFFSQLPGTRVLTFCPELETLVAAHHFTTLHWQNNRRQKGLVSQMLFSELYKIMVNEVTCGYWH